MNRKLYASFIIGITAICLASEKEIKTESAAKVLYVTHEPGTYHDYTGQRKVFEKIAKEQAWETTILSETYDGLLERFAADENFAKGYDVVVYNICVATSKNTEAAYNVIKQTKDHRVNALLVHGALHSFWPTFNPIVKGINASTLISQGQGKALVAPAVLEKWNKENPGKDFPVWGDFCGCASIKHAKKAPISVKKLIEHEAVEDLPNKYKTGISELYLSYYKMKDVSEILEGSIGKKAVAPVLWEIPYRDSKIMAFTLGHFTAEWKTPEFQSVFVKSINYLAKKRTTSK